MITLEVFFVIVECTYIKKDTPSDAKFDPETQICCRKSGVHERFQQGKEMDCCGEKESNEEAERNITHICCKNSGVHERYQDNKEVGCCGKYICKVESEPRPDKNTPKKDVKKTYGKNSEISQSRKDTTKLPGIRLSLLLHQQWSMEADQLSNERLGINVKEIKKAISRLMKVFQGAF
ncbi:uncharacterized protein LOC128185396 [Crassostrea angulata]|uniref:uncharacterized protein LOC128185396 n=1 Tax=Magallana angulata TaxID=2784310 RepID=UPI0022B17949|nr:uncharacterized protein LOC128185396 [Crassostrea angulata]